ncbi:MAG TPA: hypothetical protein VFH67_08480 [bacterium]|nr:hypothetical protein [bacterium]
MRFVVGMLALSLLAISPVVFAQGGGYGSGGGGGGDYDYGSPMSGGVVPQLRTARTHAMNAAGSEALGGAIDHLAHVVNCIEGSRGANYNSQTANPCQGQGNGLIPDLQSDSSRGRMEATKALEFARQADRLAVETLKVTDLAKVKTAAKRVADLLGEALTATGQ